MHKTMEDWINNESAKDLNDAWGFSMKQENYHLPLIKITFGEAYVMVPQYHMTNMLLTGMGANLSIKSQIYGVTVVEAAEKIGIKEEDLPPFEESDTDTDEIKEKRIQVENAIGALILEKGPYKVLGDALMSNYCWEYDPYLYDVEEEFHGDIGEEQE